MKKRIYNLSDAITLFKQYYHNQIEKNKEDIIEFSLLSSEEIIMMSKFAEFLYEKNAKVIHDNMVISTSKPRTVTCPHHKSGTEIVRNIPSMMRITIIL